MMRLFTAINFSEAEKDSICRIQRGLAVNSLSGNFSSRDNLHITLNFLGEVGESRLDDIKNVIDTVSLPAFRLTLEGIGGFSRSDVTFLNVRAENTLFRLFDLLTAGLMAAGFNLENRKYAPHLTIGRQIRLKPGFDEASFGQKIRPIVCNACRVSLMKSERIKGRLTYTEIYGKDLIK